MVAMVFAPTFVDIFAVFFVGFIDTCVGIAINIVAEVNF